MRRRKYRRGSGLISKKNNPFGYLNRKKGHKKINLFKI